MEITDWKYSNDISRYSRFKTTNVKIGEVPMGGINPIRVQSMTTVDTMDTEGSVEQILRMVEAGCEYVRVTAPSIKEAENLRNIKSELRKRGCMVPLIADIHFTPNAAELAAKIVEKVRVNPGNYADKKKFQIIEYTDEQYQAELDRIREKFTPLVKICKAEGTAMRIGTNHGSLSDRILSRYGDTPEGMVESALEFLRIARDHDYHNIVLSMKASNTQVMVQAYRLLVNQMIKEKMDYPLHLGVTEAGDGEDGRIKSAVGIGTLLEDGLGDTVRVSLTEEPEAEAPVAKTLVDRYKLRKSEPPIIDLDKSYVPPFSYSKRKSKKVQNVGENQVPVVVGDLSYCEKIKHSDFEGFGYSYSSQLDKWNIGDLAADFIFIGNQSVDFEIPGTLGLIQNYDVWKTLKKDRHYPLIDATNIENVVYAPTINFIHLNAEEYTEELAHKINAVPNGVLLLSCNHPHWMANVRLLFNDLIRLKIDIPVVVQKTTNYDDVNQFQLYNSTDFGGLFIDGLGDGIFLFDQKISTQSLMSTVFGILQATRTRISKTEYISCPSCGRTLFDLQETTAMIRSRTAHLKGVKIGIMGCIVNGPGEMADADYGYVGSGVGKITLYKGQEVVKRSIPSESAVDELIKLIQDHGDWVEKA